MNDPGGAEIPLPQDLTDLTEAGKQKLRELRQQAGEKSQGPGRQFSAEEAGKLEYLGNFWSNQIPEMPPPTDKHIEYQLPGSIEAELEAIYPKTNTANTLESTNSQRTELSRYMEDLRNSLIARIVRSDSLEESWDDKGNTVLNSMGITSLEENTREPNKPPRVGHLQAWFEYASPDAGKTINPKTVHGRFQFPALTPEEVWEFSIKEGGDATIRKVPSDLEHQSANKNSIIPQAVEYTIANGKISLKSLPINDSKQSSGLKKELSSQQIKLDRFSSILGFLPFGRKHTTKAIDNMPPPAAAIGRIKQIINGYSTTEGSPKQPQRLTPR